MKGLGEAFVTVAHCQTWILICTYEFQMMFFPRAWSSVGRAVRLAMMMGLNRVDGVGLDVKQVLPPPRDWTEEEERRRTFWMAYCVDRYASMGTGWPLAVDERDVSLHKLHENAFTHPWNRSGVTSRQMKIIMSGVLNKRVSHLPAV